VDPRGGANRRGADEDVEGGGVSENRLVVTNGAESDEWPLAVKRAFMEFELLADRHGFHVMCAVGMNMAHQSAQNWRLSCFFSPRASSNPHRAEMCADIAEMFQKMSERSKQ
jgi:hypothetical protein